MDDEKTVRLTREEIAAWQARANTVRHEIEALKTELRGLTEKLWAAEQLWPELTNP